jgi:hypothetical protein
VLRDGVILGGPPIFWSVGSCTVGAGTWKGDLVTNQRTPYRSGSARPIFAGREVATGLFGTFRGDDSEVFGASLAGRQSVSFRATLLRASG